MTEYDLARREQIREALLAYVREHKIGIPRLAARIKDAVHRNPTIPVKTLQRFMKGEVRTIDMQVGFLASFVEKVSKDDPTPRLGSALSAFYSFLDKTDWSGSFLAAESAPTVTDSGDDYSSKIEITFDQGTWRVKEISSAGRSQRVYDGVMTSSASTIFMVLKDRLAGLPRTITVCRQFNGNYEGVATAGYFPRAEYGGFLTQFRATMRSAQIQLKR
jgi:hypothetical protein